MIIECTEKDDYVMYRICSNSYLPLLCVHIIAAEELCDGHFDPILLTKPLRLVYPLHPALT